MAGTFIGGRGVFHPDRVVPNSQFEAKTGATDEWIREKTGIEQRRYADDGVDSSDLGARATEIALANAGWDPGDVDLLVCSTSTPDCLIPPTASYICEKLGLRSVAFDVNAACAGFAYGLAVVDALVQSQSFERAAFCIADKYSKVLDVNQRSSILFGDSGATLLLQRDRPEVGAEIVDIHLENLNEGADLVRIPLHGHFEMDGPAVKRIATKGLEHSARTILARNGLEPSDLRAFMAHQANLRMLEGLSDALKLDPDQHWTNVARFGNQGAAGVVATFCEGVDGHERKLDDGDFLLMTVYGSGFTGGSALLRWVDARRPAEPSVGAAELGVVPGNGSLEPEPNGHALGRA